MKKSEHVRDSFYQDDEASSLVDSSEFGSNDSDMETISNELNSLCRSKKSERKCSNLSLIRHSKNSFDGFRPKSTTSVAAYDKRSSKRIFALPLHQLPANIPGILWCGTFHRIPLFIFSQKHMINKTDVVENLGRIFNMTFRFVRIESKLLRGILSSHGFQESLNHLGKFNLLWTGSHLNPYQLRLLADFHKINHFPRSYELTRKDRLARNVQKMQKLKGIEYFDFIPQSFILPDEFREFCAAYLHERGLFIVKPMASSRGRGIFIISHPEEAPFDEPCIVSRYIAKPYLIDGFKFDVRIYVAVTSYEPLVIYIYEEGLVRFATIRYQSATRHIRTQCMHLTNYSVNKKNFEFVQNNDENVEDFGNKWSLGALLRFLQSDGVDATGLMLRIEEIIIKSFLCVQTPVALACGTYQASKGRCFELYGFDIIVDKDLRPWLLEVNLSPSLNCDSPLDLKVKSHMLTDLLNLVGVTCHDPTRKTQGGTRSRLHVMANGLAAVPAKSSSYFTTAQEQVTSHIKASISIPSERNTAFTRSLSASSISLQDQDYFPPAVDVAEFFPPGLTLEEAKLIRRIQEESCRAGGWIRLLPNPEVWEQYANLWPNESGHCYGSLDRTTLYDRAGANYTVNTSSSTFVARTHELYSDNRRISMNSSLVSAYCAASAVATLNSITASVYAKQLASNSGRLSQISGIGNGQYHSNNCETSQHPNSCRITVHLASYLQKRTVRRRKSERISQNSHRIPSIEAVSKVRLPLHSLSPIHLQNCLNSVLKSDSGKSSGDSPSSEDYQRTVSCYKHTTSHMPFYLRQLGQAPQSIPGVYLSIKLESFQPDTCPVTSGKRVPTPKANNAVTPTRRAVSSKTTPINTLSENGHHSAKSSEGSIYRTRLEKQDNHRSSQLSLCKEPTANKCQVSVIQARHAFAAYLSRINDRLLVESVDPNPSFDLDGDEKQIELLCKFLKRVALTLSTEAVTTICCKNLQSTDMKDMDRQAHFTVPTLDKGMPIKERKSTIAECLGLFIQIYQYETVAILSPNNRNSPTSEEIDSKEFWKFIHEASEAELEEFLTTYTHSYQTMHNILQPVAPGVPYQTSRYKEDKRHPRVNSNLLTSKPTSPGCKKTTLTMSRPTGDQVISSGSHDTFNSSLDRAFEDKSHPSGEAAEDTPRTAITKLWTWTSCCLPPSDGFGDSKPGKQALDHDTSSLLVNSNETKTKGTRPSNSDLSNDIQNIVKSNTENPACRPHTTEKPPSGDDRTVSSWQSKLCLPLQKIRNSSMLSNNIKSSSSTQHTTMDSYSQTSKGRITMRPSRNRLLNESKMHYPPFHASADRLPKHRTHSRTTGSSTKRYTDHKTGPVLPLYQIRSIALKTNFHGKPQSRTNSLGYTGTQPTHRIKSPKLTRNSYHGSNEDYFFSGHTPLSGRKEPEASSLAITRRKILKPNSKHCPSRRCTPFYRSNSTRRIYPPE